MVTITTELRNYGISKKQWYAQLRIENEDGVSGVGFYGDTEDEAIANLKASDVYLKHNSFPRLDRRIQDLGREAGERRAQLTESNAKLESAKFGLERAFLGLVASIIVAALLLAPLLVDQSELLWAK
jgi:hypothetical protein